MNRHHDPTRNFAVGRTGERDTDDGRDGDAPLADHEDSTRAIRPSERGAIPVTDEVAARVRDVIIIRLRRRKVSLRDIGRILNVSHETIRTRIKAIPPAVRAYYEEGVL